jgi:putative ABC transport system permease protein
MLVHDIRLAIRNLAHRPAFTLTALLLLALGAGANAAVLSVVRGVLWLPLPFGAPERLVAVWPGEFVSNEEVAFWRERAQRLEQVGSLAPGWLMALAVNGAEPQKVTGAKVSDNLFALLQVQPSLGRTFTAGESTPGRDRVVVLSDRLWRQQFAADPAVLGRIVLVDQAPYTVIGVMPNTFELFGRASDLWVPIPFAPGTSANRATFSLAIGRLRPGATVESASGELLALAPEMRGALGRPADWGHTIRAAALHEAITSQVRPALTVLFTAVGLILLLGSVNLGTLVLGRSLERSRELAVRAAIGASRRQLLRQLLVEQVVLAATGSLIGLALAQGSLPLLLSRIPPEVPRQAEIALDGVVFAAILATSIGLALALALAPVLLAIRPGLQPLLRQQAATDSPGRGRALGGLVSAQIGLALVLGTGAGLMLRSVWNLQHVEPGFNPDGVLSFRLQTTSKYRALTTGVPYLRQVAERVRTLPGVTAVGGIGHLPMSGYSWTIRVHRVDQPPVDGASAAEVGWRFIWGDYLEAMRIPLISGRSFTDADTISATRVAMVNEALARQFFGSPAAALGQRLVQKGGGSPDDTIVEIVGIVGDVRHEALNEPPRSELFRPLLQTFMFPMHMVAGTVGAPADLAGAVRTAAFDVDPTVPVAELMPLTTLLADTLGKPRLLALLLSLFAAVGVLQCMVALYGVIAVRVRQREREIGIRMALGALPSAVAIGVVRQGLRYAALGTVVGVPAALALTRLMDSVVFGVTTRDPLTFTVLPVILAMVTTAACYLPARRAARVDPVRAMKAE